MDATTLAWWLGLVLGLVPLVLQLVWHWNDVRFVASLKLRGGLRKGAAQLLPGYMGLPFLGETLSLLWYFKILRRPDDFIQAKKQRYGEGVGMYRSHLFGSPTIITCSPASNKFILQSSADFHLKWPSPELVGTNSMLNKEGEQHSRVKSFLVNAVNQPKALRLIADAVQPRIISALQSWAEKGTITAYHEAKKVTFENTCKIFVSMEPGTLLSKIDKWFCGLVPGFRAYPLNFPGTAFHHALQCRRKLDAVFRAELEDRKQRKNKFTEGKDLMDGLMNMKDLEGNQLSDDEVVDNIVSLIVGGHESISLASMWALYHLSKSSDILQRLREENAKISKQKKADFITLEDISELKYTAKVVEETIRIANIAWVLFRVAKRDIDYGGYIIPKDWQVLVWLRSIHTDPKNFDDPLQFKPERWNAPAEPGTFQVFGGGARVCAGNMLARLQLTILLHHLALGYRWELLNPDAKIKYLPHARPVDGAAMAFHAIG